MDKQIQSALANSKVAVLLVSPDFLASDFIHEHDFGPLLKEAEKGGVKILWVPVRKSAYKQTPLKDYQAVFDPGKPLAGMPKAKRDQALVEICEEIEKAVNPRSELERAVMHVENKVNIQEKELAWIKTLIQLFLSDSARTNRKKFAEDGPFMSDIERGSGFEWELRHLLSLQLIERVPGKRMSDPAIGEPAPNWKRPECLILPQLSSKPPNVTPSRFGSPSALVGLELLLM
jgi:hypothetical protein